MRAKRLTLQQRRDIFLALVEAQDAGVVSIHDTRQAVMDNFKITDTQLRQIEDEGVEKDWPPLDQAISRVG